MDWLGLMKDHRQQLQHCRDDFDLPGMADKGGCKKPGACLAKELDGFDG